MACQMAQEGAFWPSVIIRFGPHWCNSKIKTFNVVQNVGTKNTERLPCITWLEQVKNTLV